MYTVQPIIRVQIIRLRSKVAED